MVRYLAGGLLRASSPWHINALTKNTARCTARIEIIVLSGSKIITATSATTDGGCNATTSQCGITGRRANAITQGRRESASGSTQSIGTAATSVEMGAGTATRRPAGTAATA